MKHIISIIFLTITLGAASQAFSWGSRGHHSICEAAVYLIQSKDLKDFLLSRTHMMGHLCNIPDTSWRSLPSELTKLGNPAHYINPEKINLKVKDIPLDPKEIEKKYKISMADLGFNWWRAEQLHRLSSQKKSNFDDTIFNFITHSGIMGHFVGDNSQPFHVTADYDGYEKGHGGIHGYYESDVVDLLPINLTQLIVQKAQKLRKEKADKKFIKGSVLETMKALAELSESEIEKVLKLDQIIKPSNSKSERGMSLKTRAERKHPSQAAKKFENLITEQMARSSLILAHLWEKSYDTLEKPNLKNYRSFKYPFEPEFIKPDLF